VSVLHTLLQTHIINHHVLHKNSLHIYKPITADEYKTFYFLNVNSLVVHLVMCESSFIISFHPKPIPANIVNVVTMVIGILLEFFHFL